MSFHPYQPQDMIGESLVACDVQLAVLDSPFTGLAVPCKLYGMLASGKPAIVVCEEQGEMARVVEELECGFVVSPGDVDGLVDAISRLMSDDSLRKQMGRRARQACVRQYTLAEVAGRYVNVIRSVQDCYRATK
ncbi:MAG: glycosyltransferase [Phycisphaerae bacterium]